MQPGLNSLVLLPLAFGLLDFVEPCSMGSTLIVIKSLEGKSGATKLAQVGLFAATRALFIGLLGMVAVVLGAAFLGVQRDAWIALGAIYMLIGALVISRPGAVMVALGPSLARLSDLRGSASLGLLFGLNVPPCAMPLILALLAPRRPKARPAARWRAASRRWPSSASAYRCRLFLPCCSSPPGERSIGSRGCLGGCHSGPGSF